MPHWSVEDREEEDGQGGEGNIVGSRTDAVHQGLPREAIVELEEEEQEGKSNIFEERILDEPRQPVH